jgi:hypothetical protein
LVISPACPRVVGQTGAALIMDRDQSFRFEPR